MTVLPSVLSTIKTAPLSYFVYSSLSFFGRLRDGELPGMWFVRALRDAGRDTAAIRQTLYRMESEGELLTRKVGRVKFYRATDYANAEIDAGLSKIFDRPRRGWDGRWTIVCVHLRSPAQRVARERVVALLAVEGFALLGNDVYLHPRDVGPRLSAALSVVARAHVIILRGPLENAAPSPALVALWNVQRLAARYHAVQGRLRELDSALSARFADREAFLLRFAVVFDFHGVAWDDPDLPREVLPNDWPGEDTRRLAARLYKRLLGPAIRYGESLLAGAVPSPAPSERKVRS